MTDKRNRVVLGVCEKWWLFATFCHSFGMRSANSGDAFVGKPSYQTYVVQLAFIRFHTFL